MKINKERLECFIGEKKVMFFSILCFVFIFGMVLIFNKGTYSVGDGNGNSVSIFCPDVVAAGDSIQCDIQVSVLTMEVQGIVGKYNVSDDLKYVSFSQNSDIWKMHANDETGFVLVNIEYDGIRGNNVIGTMKYTVPEDAKANMIYQVGLNEIEIGDGDNTTIVLNSIYDEVRVLSNINTLDSLSITDVSLNEEFNGDKKIYSANVNTDKITINAVKTDKYSKVSGDVGELDVHYGTNVFEIIVTSEDGTINKYVINVYRDYEFTIDKYVYNKEDNYLYTGMDVDNDVILSRINVDSDIVKTIKDDKLLIMYEDYLLDAITLVNISSAEYDLSKNYIYLGTSEELDVSKINMLNCVLERGSNRVLIKYGETVLKYFDLLSVNFGNLKLDDKKIMIDSDISYNNFIDNITVSNGIIYKIFNGNNEITSGNIEKNMILKIYYNNEELDSYVIVRDEYLEIDDSLSVDDDNGVINNLVLGTLIDDVINKINTSGNVVVLDKDDNIVENRTKLRTGDKIKIELSEETIIYRVSVKGDVNGDGKIGINDVIQVSKHCVYGEIINGIENINAGDINNDGGIGILDLIKLAKYLINGQKLN